MKFTTQKSWKITSFTRNRALQNPFINHLETWHTHSSGATLIFPRNALPRISLGSELLPPKVT